MMRVGLTGGIGCGKSAAAEYFQSEYDIPVIDADRIAHQLTQAGEPALQRVVEKFGRKVLCEDGSLNRKLMRSLIFQDAHKKKMLEDILHPVIRQQMLHQTKSLQTSYCILVIPLLIESGMQDIVDCIVVIDCPLDTQIQRVIYRNQYDAEEVRKIIASQCTRQKRLEVADIIVNNDRDTESLRRNIKSVHLELLGKSNG